MRPDPEIKFDVEQEVHADPALDAADIAMAVRDGMVRLTGFVRFYRHKHQAKMAAKQIAGVTVAHHVGPRRASGRGPSPPETSQSRLLCACRRAEDAGACGDCDAPPACEAVQRVFPPGLRW